MRRAALFLALALSAMTPHVAAAFEEAPSLREAVDNGTLPPVNERLPLHPEVIPLSDDHPTIGQYGGELRMLMSQPRDTRMMVVYSYARLVGYDPDWQIKPDILESMEVKEGRQFTFHLRPGHKWSDGYPFTADDFRFFWEDVAMDPDLSPGGPDQFLRVRGNPPKFEVLDPLTVRYTWDKPNPNFLPALAGARPEYIFMPAHYAKNFHARYQDVEKLNALAKEEGQRKWTALFTRKTQQYRNDNPDLPTLDPWILKTTPPSTRFVFERNPYFHRVDAKGQQLPYIDRVAVSIANPQLIPAKTAAGDADLQARGLSFENYTVLKQGEKRNDYHVRLWQSGRGSELALYPNLTASDTVWRDLMRDVRFRRALSLATNRKEINQAIFFGLASPGNDTVLLASPLFRPEYASRWAEYDPEHADRLLDEIGLTERNSSGTRLLPDGRAAELTIETAGESPTEIAILQLIRDHWRDIGIQVYIKPEQRDVLRNRVFAGSTIMSTWTGLENGLATAGTSPAELAPTNQQQLCWSKWGQYVETSGKAGEQVDMEAAKELLSLYQEWTETTNEEDQTDIWHRMLSIRADRVFSIGTVRGVPQPVVVANTLRNVPREAIYNWEPTAYFGVYHMDLFWFDAAQAALTKSP